MSETKHQAFHRLAQARKEALLDKVRLFGQLSGPSYDWTPDEVWAYFEEITQGLEQALARFQEQKRWGPSPASTAPAAPQPDDEAPSDPEPEADLPPLDPLTKEQWRKLTIGQMIERAKNDPEHLPTMLVLQQEMIADLTAQLAQFKPPAPVET